MSRQVDQSELRDAQALTTMLFDAVNRIEYDDLSTLAQMHGWCEQLVAITGDGNAESRSPVGDKAVGMVRHLEALILGEVEDAAEEFRALGSSIAELLDLVCASGGGLEPAQLASAEDELLGVAETPDEAVPEPAVETSGPAEPLTAVSEPTPVEVSSADSPVESALATGSVEMNPEDATPSEATVPGYQSEPLRLNPNETEFVKGFVEEAREHIEAIETAVLEVERNPDASDKINDLFRPFHTIKGMAGFLNLRDVNSLTHEVETLLDQGRKGQRVINAAVIDLVFSVVDILKVQVSSIAAHLADPQGETVPQPPVSEMIDRLRGVVAGRIELSDRPAAAASGSGHLGENLVAEGVVPQAVVDHALQVQKKQPNRKTGEILIEMGVATPKQVSKAIRQQTQASVQSSAAPAGGSTPSSSVGESSLRIDTAKLDALVDMVGELVIAQTQVGASQAVMSDPKLSRTVDHVTKIVRNVQEAGMAMRMVPIGSTFQKMARLVRDVSRKADKQVELSISGEDTELDKNVIQQISDPLVHMVRNAVDHGVESSEARVAAGKDPVGHVHLAAYHQGGNIVIEISDDGKGLDPKQLIAKGIEKGLVQPGEELTDQQAYHLIFAAGFSTASQVTDISGRGVGMDVVRRNLEQLRGRVDITSVKGQGTTFHIRLPLTLAIIDGMVVNIASERFIIPTITIEQALRPLPDQVFSVQQRGEMIQVRGQLIPLIQLGEMFGLTSHVDPCQSMVVIAVCDGQHVGLVVENLLGQQQVVIKSLGERFEQLKGVAGAAILGDGRVGLILDPPGLAAFHDTYQRTRQAGGHIRPALSVEGTNESSAATAA